MKIVNIDKKIFISLYLYINLRNFNEIFRKDVTYDTQKEESNPSLKNTFSRRP